MTRMRPEVRILYRPIDGFLGLSPIPIPDVVCPLLLGLPPLALFFKVAFSLFNAVLGASDFTPVA